jgi:hypothetical protein
MILENKYSECIFQHAILIQLFSPSLSLCVLIIELKSPVVARELLADK